VEINREMLNDFWKTIGFEQGTNRVVINYGQQQIYMDDFYLLNKNDKYYIHDKRNNKLFDQELNYYQDGKYYNRKGELIQDISNDNIIDIEPDKVYKTKSNNIIEHFNSEGNPYKLTPQEAFDKYGPDDDRFYTSQGLDPIEQKKKIDELNSKREPLKTDKEKIDEVSIKSEEYDKFVKENEDILFEAEKLKEDISILDEDIAEEISEKVSKKIPKELPKKKLSKDIDFKKAGIISAAVAATGLAIYGLGKHNKNKKEERQYQQTPNYQTHVANTTQARYDNNMMYNMYAQQMAKDISTYRYGKQMTGFV
jgi:hypothetical protein